MQFCEAYYEAFVPRYARAVTPALQDTKASALKIVAKTFISLTSQKPNEKDHLAPLAVFADYRLKLTNAELHAMPLSGRREDPSILWS